MINLPFSSNGSFCKSWAHLRASSPRDIRAKVGEAVYNIEPTHIHLYRPHITLMQTLINNHCFGFGCTHCQSPVPCGCHNTRSWSNKATAGHWIKCCIICKLCLNHSCFLQSRLGRAITNQSCTTHLLPLLPTHLPNNIKQTNALPIVTTP